MTGFFTVEKRKDRWWFVTPEGKPFWSIGMNHIDAAAIRFVESDGVWERDFGNSQERWLASVADDLHDWGFNTIGWTQEVVIINKSFHRHSRPFTYEEYQWAGMPYCHLLPFTEAHQWQVEVRQPDVMSPDFEEWCDYVARDECARFRDDPKLIGYFYCDCPQWVHTCPETEWRGSLADPRTARVRSRTAKALRHRRTLLQSHPRRHPPLRSESPNPGRPLGSQPAFARGSGARGAALHRCDELPVLRHGREHRRQNASLGQLRRPPGAAG